jgi:prepilin-type N-terminal cleavage/methylation domain-containing protein
MKMFHRGEKGFTLIELLIVVAILGIIAAVVIPNISGFMITGELSAANSEAENVKTATLGYFGEYGFWPTSSEQLVPDYITGTMKAVYAISEDYGWLLSVASNQTWTLGITFAPGVDASDGNHGEWVRATS